MVHFSPFGGEDVISFIIISENNVLTDLLIKIVKRFLYGSNDYYRVHDFSSYNSTTWSKICKIEGKRIYLISSELTKVNCFDLDRKIREDLSVIDPIILVTPKSKKISIKRSNGALILEIIEQNRQFVKDMFIALESAYKVSNKILTLSFSSFDEVYRLPYDDIYYIEKDINDDTITIYTKDDTYTHYSSIKKMAIKLSDDIRFFKIHRSCIINIFKVCSFNCKSNIITFDNGMTINLVSKDRKKEFINRLKKQI